MKNLQRLVMLCRQAVVAFDDLTTSASIISSVPPLNSFRSMSFSFVDPFKRYFLGAFVPSLLMLMMLIACSSAHAADSAVSVEGLIQQAQTLALDKKPQWRVLLHIPKNGSVSQVNTPEFFLDPHGRDNAAAEMRTDLAAFFAPFEDANQHARCRFPARQVWLARQLRIPELANPDRRCVRIWKWLDLDHLKSSSVTLVSGYFGNPASTFGHALLRFDAGGADQSKGLTDLSLNFGALVPENENMLLYIKRGLLGDYDAGFSDKDFIEQDQVYVRGENRDMWNYELALTPDDLQLLALHVWEIAGKKFSYFFLSRNCAWRLAELLELVIPVDLRHGADETWYVPVELFNRLESAQRQGTPTYHEVRFQASAQRQLVDRLSQLTPDERVAFNRFVTAGDTQTESILATLSAEQALRVLDVVMDWTNWKNPTGKKDGELAITEKIKRQVLLARLALPVGTSNLTTPAVLQSPGAGTPPMRFGIGLNHSDANATGLGLQWTAVSFDLNGYHGLEPGELQVANIKADVMPNQGLHLQELTAASVRKLNLQATEVIGEADFSWQLKLGAKRLPPVTTLRPYFSVGLGQAGKLIQDHLYAFAFLDVEALARPYAVGLSPNAGIIWASGPWHSSLEYRRTLVGQSQSSTQIEAKLERQITSADVLSFRLSNDVRSRVGLYWQHYQ